ncbi:thermonuclease family protein [uncultured Demequina sp.]|uniref:thermonuclease family protein n=1 Tax=uncultured Demequina sp. TaxID=693499 RepID=UPI0025D2A2C9|nr:thermonuclease family protein [uncultured Demequina sp.]
MPRSIAAGALVVATAIVAAGCAVPSGGDAASLDLAGADTAAAQHSDEPTAQPSGEPTPGSNPSSSDTEPSEPAATASAPSEPGESETDVEAPSESSGDGDARASQAGSTSGAKPAATVTVTHVVDGDTVYTSDGGKIRLIGYDTPETGECGFGEAKAFVADLVLDKQVELVNPASVDDVDKYDRLLRYITVGGTDLGTAVLKAGLANARYDSLDGYDRHPQQDRYRAISKNTEHVCATGAAEQDAEAQQDAVAEESEADGSTTADAATEPWNQPGPDLNCSDIQQVVQITGTDYHRLDRDGDGWACESYG